MVNYEADIFDRTQNSLTKNMRPEIIRVDADQQAKLSAGKNIGYVMQFIAKSQIWFICSESIHAFMPGDPLEMLFKVSILYTLEYLLHQPFNRLMSSRFTDCR